MLKSIVGYWNRILCLPVEGKYKLNPVCSGGIADRRDA
jgi:hypothetical protein